MKTTIKNFMELTRMWSVQLSIAPFVVALLWALGYGVSKFNVILAFVAVICLHLGGNLLDDIIDDNAESEESEEDYESEEDIEEVEENQSNGNNYPYSNVFFN